MGAWTSTFTIGFTSAYAPSTIYQPFLQLKDISFPNQPLYYIPRPDISNPSSFFLSSRFSNTTLSVVKIVPATDAAFSNAVRVTLTGSNNPSLIAFAIVFVFTLYIKKLSLSPPFNTSCKISYQLSLPALSNILMNGA
jgi:hypothetical protein